MSVTTKKWVMHILRPDDVIEQPDELTALRAANATNKKIAKMMEDRHPDDPYIVAIAEEV